MGKGFPWIHLARGGILLTFIPCDKYCLNDKYNERLFTQLNPNDKRVFKRFVKGIKLDISINDDTEKEFQKNYQILKGEFQSGNDSPEIKNALKKYILEGLAENKINKNECHFLLYQLSL